ncbi:MAG: hypothetical protein EOM24_16040, partial [Chloroflexia bacterium]|nr:hypothetical protein [Chloroflexia bacterium]
GRIVRVIVVGSVAGGMSGTITDLAYLARQAAHMVVPKDGTIYIEGYFATPEVFRTVAANPDALNINAAATLRELQRFQLNQGLPFPFSYQTEVDPQRGYLKGDLSVPMLDYITLFGGSGEPERGTGKADEPWATVLASMADTIALRLDRAVNAGAQGDYRSGLHAQATTKQTSTQKAIVVGTGSYVVRVPIVDIQEIVEARWARKLFHVFLNGSVDSELPSFNPDEAGMEAPVANYAKEFILGQHVAGEPPHGMSTVAYLTGTGKVRARDVIDLANDEEGRPYYDYLGYALGLILNGDQQGSFARRAPRLGYAQEFLTAVLTYFTEALNEARNQGAIAPAVEERSWFQRLNIWFGGGKANQNEWNQVVKRLQAWIEVTKQALASLEAMRNILIGGDQRPNSNGSVSLYQELAQRQAKAEQRREQMDRIAVRRYLWRRPLSPDRDPAEPDNQVELVDEWYEQVEPRVAEHLQRFRWNIDRNGSLALRLVTFEKDAQKAIALDAASHSITAIADEIERLAKSVTQDLVSNVALHELLLTMMPSKLADPTADLVRLMWRTALPHIRYAQTPNQTIDGEMQAVAGLPPQLQKGQAPHPLQVSFQNLGGPRTLIENTENPVPTNVIESTDSMAITLVREYSLMPLIGLPEYKSIWAYYQRNAGSANDTMVESPLLATVYAAERASLEYERRLERGLNQDFRALHPIIVMGLARPELAERYL